MSEHYTRNTEWATFWCTRCRRNTQHRIDEGRRGPCLDPQHPKPLVRAVIPKFDLKESEQGILFPEKKL